MYYIETRICIHIYHENNCTRVSNRDKFPLHPLETEHKSHPYSCVLLFL